MISLYRLFEILFGLAMTAIVGGIILLFIGVVVFEGIWAPVTATPTEYVGQVEDFTYAEEFDGTSGCTIDVGHTKLVATNGALCRELETGKHVYRDQYGHVMLRDNRVGVN